MRSVSHSFELKSVKTVESTMCTGKAVHLVSCCFLLFLAKPIKTVNITVFTGKCCTLHSTTYKKCGQIYSRNFS